MIDEAKALRRGEGARQLLESEPVQEAFADMRAQLLEEFRRAPISGHENLVRLKMALQSVDGLETRLKAYIADSTILIAERDAATQREQFTKDRGYAPH